MTQPQDSNILYDHRGNRLIISHQPGVADASRVIGHTGLKNLGGRIQEDYLTTFRAWPTQVDTYLQMRDDITIGTLLESIKLPLLSADFDVEPASDQPADLAARDFLWDAMNRMDRQTWRSHVSDALESIDFGWSIGEMVLEKRRDGRLWLKNIDPRGQETLHKWEFDEHDHTLAFIQRDPDTGHFAPIPIEKTVHMVFRGRKGNPQGKALLRDLWRNWKFIKALEDYEGIGLERNVGGMPVATLPEQPITPEDSTALEAALAGLRMDEEMYLILPNGLEVNPYSGTTNVAPIGTVITRKQQEILMRFFAQFLALGMQQVGSNALVKGSQDFFTLGLEAIQQDMLEAWNQQLVPYLFRFNPIPGMSDLPRISWDTPGKVDVTSMLDALTKAKGIGAYTPTREDEEHLRAITDLPDLPEGVGEGNRNVPAPRF